MSPAFFAIIGDIGGAELLLIFVLVLILFGGKRLPEFARGLGRSIREFKKATSGVEAEIRRVMEEPPPPPRKPTTAVATPAQAALPSGTDTPTGVLTDDHAYDYEYDHDPYHSAPDPHHPGPHAPSPPTPADESQSGQPAPADVPPAGTPAPPPPPAKDGESSPPKEPGSSPG